MGKKFSRHHTVPRKRKKKKGRLVRLPDKFHSALHQVFVDLYGKEMIVFIQELVLLMDTEDEITLDDLHRLRQEVKNLELYEYER